MRTLLALFLAVCMMSCFAQAAGVMLVEDGVARATIVVEKDSEKAQKAAEELQTFIDKMSGAKLPIVADGEAVAKGMSEIHVGHTARAKRIAPNIPSGFDPTPRPDTFDGEGFVLKTDGNALVVAGNNDGPYQGTLYAAYDLLTRLGCRWFLPGEWGQVIPEKKTITVDKLDILSRPDFAVRNQNIGGWCPVSREERTAYSEWQVRVGMTNPVGYNTARFYPVAGDGFLGALVDPKVYFEAHPEWYAMNEAGVRKAYWHRAGWYYDQMTMLCLSNKEMYAEAVKNVKAALAGEKKLKIMSPSGIGISPPDGAPYCYCEECKKASQGFKYPRYADRTFQSEEFFGFSAELAREFPDIFVGTMAYSLREIAPQGLGKLPKNVSVVIAPISCDVLHPNDSKLWRRRDFMRNLKRWTTLTDHITIYDYNPGFLLGCWIPERDAENFAVNAPIYHKLGVKGFVTEGRKAFMQTWISYYARAKLMWDADADLDAIKADFYSTLFGEEAGKHVRAWWDACAEALLNDPMQAHEDWLINHIYTEPFAKSLMKHVDAAKAAKATPEQKARIEAFALIADHFLAYGEMVDAEKELNYARAAEAAGRMYQREVELHEINPWFHQYYPKGHLRPYFPAGLQNKFLELAAKSGGEKGTLVAGFPKETAFKRDPFNEGIVGEWYLPGFDAAKWDTRNTAYTWDQQEEPQDEVGHDWDGYGWYRFTFDLPAELKGRKIFIYGGGVINEGWTWVNGEYVGHKDHLLWWNSPAHSFEYDITNAVQFGKKNTVAIRVLNDAEIGGLYRRGFIWAENEAKETKEEAAD